MNIDNKTGNTRATGINADDFIGDRKKFFDSS